MLFLGYHGKLNAGDDAISLSLLTTLDQIAGKHNFFVYAKENYFRNLFSANQRIIFVNSYVSIFKAFLKSKIVILDGGDHLNDYGSYPRSLRVFIFFFLISLLTKFLRKKFTIVNGGFGTKKQLSSVFLRLILNLSSHVSVRDGYSYVLSSNLSKAIFRSFDTAALLDLSKLPRKKADVEKICVGISVTPVFANYFLNPPKDKILELSLADQINNLLSNTPNVTVFFLALNSDTKVGDIGMINRIMPLIEPPLRKRIGIMAYTGDISQFLTLFSKLDVVVCCKYHSIIFSYILNKPMVVVEYHPKNTIALREIGLDRNCALSVEDVINGQLLPTIESLIKNPDKYTAKLPINYAKQKALAGINYSVIDIV